MAKDFDIAAGVNDGDITTNKLADSAVTTAKISNGSINSDKIASGNLAADAFVGDGSQLTGVIPSDGSVTTAKIADSAVTTAKIATGAVTSDKIDPDVSLGDGFFKVDSTNSRVGIGTSSPSKPLHLSASAANTAVRLSSVGGTGRDFDITSATSGALTISSDLQANLAIFDGINGNVGIGTSSPTSKLHVSDGYSTFNSNNGVGLPQFTAVESSAQVGLFRSGSSAGGGYIGGDANYSLTVFNSSLNELLRVTPTGTTWLGSTNSARNVNSFRYVSTASSGNVYVHMKTNRPVTATQMYSVTFRGHSYNQSSPIDASLCWYNYNSANNVVRIGSTGTHSCSAYKSSDGFAVMTMYVPNHYYVAFTMDQFTTAQGLAPITVTNVTYSASATGVY